MKVKRPLRQVLHKYWNGWMSITASRNYHHNESLWTSKNGIDKKKKKTTQPTNVNTPKVAYRCRITNTPDRCFTCMQPLHRSSTYKPCSSGHRYSHLICLQQAVEGKLYLQGTKGNQHNLSKYIMQPKNFLPPIKKKKETYKKV